MSRSYKKPWVKDYQPYLKKIHSRRYRRFIRQDVKQWRNRYTKGIISYCGSYWEWSEDMFSKYWDWDEEILFWRSTLSLQYEPEYSPRNKWINIWNVCDWRIYWVDIDPTVKYLRK